MRFVIKNADGRFYTGNNVPETIYVPRASNPREADPVCKLVPEFHALTPAQALKYDSEADARDMCTHCDLVDPAAFAGCEVQPES